MNNNVSRLKYLDGLRGFAAIIVMLCHIITAFYPHLYSVYPPALDDQTSLVKIIDSTPMRIFYQGNFALMLFFVISGYVITWNYFNRRDENYITSSAFRRYFRLTIPALFACVIAYLILKFDLFFNIEAASLTNSSLIPSWLMVPYRFDADFIEMIKFALYGQYFNFHSETSYIIILWAGHALLLGPFLIYSFLAIFGQLSKRWILYVILVILFYNSLLLAFILGMIICDLDVNNVLQKINKIIIVLILFASIYFGSFTSTDFEFYKPLYSDFINSHFQLDLLYFYNTIGAALLIFAISRTPFLMNALATKIPLYLGKISFPIFLLHSVIICSLSCYLFTVFVDYCSYFMSFFFVSVITIILTIIVSHIFYNYIEVNGIKLSKSLYNFISR
jgi:peptidoglycan/LPS O-acetylase OafA/YrhL